MGSVGLVKVEIKCFLFVTWPRYRSVTWLCEWSPLILSHHPAKFGVHRPYGTGNNGVCNISSNSSSNSNAEVRMSRFTNGLLAFKNFLEYYTWVCISDLFMFINTYCAIVPFHFNAFRKWRTSSRSIKLKGNIGTKWVNKVLSALREKCPYSEFSWSYFPAFGLNTSYLSVFNANAGKHGPAFSLNAGKYRPEKLRLRTLFTQCKLLMQKLLPFICTLGQNVSEKCCMWHK